MRSAVSWWARSRSRQIELPAAARDLRIGYGELRDRLDGSPGILDVRLEAEYVGKVTAPSGYDAIAQRSGHIPGAI